MTTRSNLTTNRASRHLVDAVSLFNQRSGLIEHIEGKPLLKPSPEHEETAARLLEDGETGLWEAQARTPHRGWRH